MSKVERLATSCEKLSKKDAIAVFSRWLSEFGIKGPGSQLQSRILRSATAAEYEALDGIALSENEETFVIVEYEKPHMEVYSAVGFDAEKAMGGGTDYVVLRADFSKCLVINHEDGYLWKGPTLLERKELNEQH